MMMFDYVLLGKCIGFALLVGIAIYSGVYLHKHNKSLEVTEDGSGENI